MTRVVIGDWTEPAVVILLIATMHPPVTGWINHIPHGADCPSFLAITGISFDVLIGAAAEMAHLVSLFTSLARGFFLILLVQDHRPIETEAGLRGRG